MILLRKIVNYQNIFSVKNLVFLAVVFYLIPKSIFTAPGVGLDASWHIALNLAIRENLMFGKDVIFTYGPLGYLSTGLPIYVSKLSIILYYLFVVANGIYFIYYLFRSLKNRSELLIISASLVFFGWFLFWREPLSLYFYAVFHIFHFIKHKNLLSLINISLCCLLAFYLKVNAGLILNAVFLLFILYNFLFKTLNKVKSIVYFIAHITILFCLSFLLKTDFVLYIKNSMPLINSYNDAMVLVPANYEILIVGIMFLTVLIIASLSFKKFIRSFHDIFLFLNLLLFAYLLFKNGFVRQDGHVNIFYTGICFTAILGFLFSDLGKLKADLFSGVVIIVLLSVSAYKGSVWDQNKKYISGSADAGMVMAQNMKCRKLPERIIKEIGNKTTDVLGFEISYLYYNNIKYNPRPIIQSYSAFDKNLININYEKYNGNSSPDYVLYQYGSIDDRHGFWDEPKIYLALFKNYEIIDTVRTPGDTNSLLLFKKTITHKKIAEKILVDTLIHMNTKFKIPPSENILYLTLDYDYSMAGKARRILYQPSLIYMNLSYEDLTSTYCRLVLPVMKSGVPINKKVSCFADACAFFNSRGKGNLNATQLELYGNPEWVTDAFKLQIIEYKIPE